MKSPLDEIFKSLSSLKEELNEQNKVNVKKRNLEKVKQFLLERKGLLNEDFKSQEQIYINQGNEPQIVKSYIERFRKIKDKNYRQLNDQVGGLENVKDRKNIDSYKTFKELETIVKKIQQGSLGDAYESFNKHFAKYSGGTALVQSSLDLCNEESLRNLIIVSDEVSWKEGSNLTGSISELSSKLSNKNSPEKSSERLFTSFSAAGSTRSSLRKRWSAGKRRSYLLLSNWVA
jgi:hypothetical protein